MIAPRPDPLGAPTARLPVDCPFACSAVKALRNTSCARAATRPAPLVFRSLDGLRALREADRRRRDEERPLRSEQGTGRKPDRTGWIERLSSIGKRDVTIGAGRENHG
jgi:hypothetical protein